MLQVPEEIFVGHAEYLFQNDQLLRPDAVYSAFDLGIDAAADVEAVQLQLGGNVPVDMVMRLSRALEWTLPELLRGV